MSDSRPLLGRIRALRHRLTGVPPTDDPVPAAEVPVADAGERRQALLDASVRQLDVEFIPHHGGPTHLIGKVRQQLVRGRELVERLKKLAAEPLISRGDPDAEDGDDPLLQAYRDTAAMTESALRLVQAFPESASAQLRLGEGFEGIIVAVAERVEGVTAAVHLRKAELARRDALANLLQRLNAGAAVDADEFAILADYLLDEVKHSAPLRFLQAPASRPADFIAAHSINVARVLARMVRHDPDLEPGALDIVVAALLKDVGMLAVESVTLAYAGPLSDEQQRAVAGHAAAGAELVANHLPATAALCEAIAAHHERLDGSGYPAGLRRPQISPLARLLAIADVYAALCSPRPHRPALDPRTALTETLLLADRGVLDRDLAQRLLRLSFYPVGTVVELNDGSIALVVATHSVLRDPNSPARPVVAVLADAAGRLLPSPRHIDLAECDGLSVSRALPATRRRELLTRRYPELM